MAHKKSSKIDTQAIGLDVGLAFSRFLTGKENLHYGLWSEDMKVCAANVGPAQEAYTAKLFKLLPKKKSLRILDIGGGAGETAKKLVALGHTVEIVVPSAFLAGRCAENGGPTVKVHQTTFEDFSSDGTFDVCLFSESFQYIPFDVALTKAASLTAKNGVIIISDCFRAEAFWTDQDRGDRAVGGGHRLTRFCDFVADQPLDIVFEEDITAAVAPTVEIEQDLFNFFGYGLSRVDLALHAKPAVRWMFHKVINLFLSKRRRAHLDQRLNARTRTAANFCTYNRYLMMKLKPTS